MRNRFDLQLKKLHDDMVELGMFIETMIVKTMTALKTNDNALARKVREDDEVADELEMKIERRSLRILLLQQPVAKDLRTIFAALKMITDMVRICDHARNIAEIVLRFEGHGLIEKPDSIVQMSEKCVTMVNSSIAAFIKSDLELARAVMKMDDEVDKLYHGVRNSAPALVAENPNGVAQAVDFVLLAKCLERIADHAVNIAEWVEFDITSEHKSKKLF